MPGFRGLRSNPVFDPFYVDTAYENSTAKHDWNPPLVCGDPHRGLVQSFRVTLLHNVFDPRNDLESIDAAGGDLDLLSSFDFQIEHYIEQECGLFDDRHILLESILTV